MVAAAGRDDSAGYENEFAQMLSPSDPPGVRPAARTGDSSERAVFGGMGNRLSKQVKVDIGAFGFWCDIWFRRQFAEIARILGQGLRAQVLPFAKTPCTGLDFKRRESKVSNNPEWHLAGSIIDARFIRPLLHSIWRCACSSKFVQISSGNYCDGHRAARAPA